MGEREGEVEREGEKGWRGMEIERRREGGREEREGGITDKCVLPNINPSFPLQYILLSIL